jgi:DNA primase
MARIKREVPIVDFISRHMKLEPASRGEFKGKCPFHGDDSPSFYVSSGKGVYCCQGCGATGNVVSFHAALNEIPFAQAKSDLAKEYGLNDTRPGTVADPQADPAAARDQAAKRVLYWATQRYIENLSHHAEAQEYLRTRGISPETASKFGIGVCLGDEFARANAGKGLLDLGKQTGILNDRNRSIFSGRITFPIRGAQAPHAGKIIGFGGRILPSAEKSRKDAILRAEADGSAEKPSKLPKYLNSPDTELFQKSDVFYGLTEARFGIMRAGAVVIVEGYMDVMVLHQEGVDNAVAVMGTSTSERAFDRLWAQTSRILFCLDGDEAGRSGAMRGVMKAAGTMKDGCEIGIVTLPEGMDPDEFVLEHGKDRFDDLCVAAVPLSKYLAAEISRKPETDLTCPEGRTRYLKEIEKVAGTFAGAGRVRDAIEKEAQALVDAHVIRSAIELEGLLEPGRADLATLEHDLERALEAVRKLRIGNRAEENLGEAGRASELRAIPLAEGSPVSPFLRIRPSPWPWFAFGGSDDGAARPVEQAAPSIFKRERATHSSPSSPGAVTPGTVTAPGARKRLFQN